MLGLRGSNVKLSTKPVAVSENSSPARKRSTSTSTAVDGMPTTSTSTSASANVNVNRKAVTASRAQLAEATAAVDSTDSDSGVGLRSGRRTGSASASMSSLTSRVFPVRLSARKLSEPAIKFRTASSVPVRDPSPPRPIVRLESDSGSSTKPRRRFSMSNEPPPTPRQDVRAENVPKSRPISQEKGIEAITSREGERDCESGSVASVTPSTSVDLDAEAGTVYGGSESETGRETESPELEIPPIGVDLEEHYQDGRKERIHVHDHDHDDLSVSAYDQMLLEESDNLIQDVMAMCNEMGIDSSGIVTGKPKMGKHVTIVSPVMESSTSTSTSTPSEAPLPSAPPRIWSPPPEPAQSVKKVAMRKVNAQEEASSTTYDRIMSTLRLIEEDELQQQAKTKAGSNIAEEEGNLVESGRAESAMSDPSLTANLNHVHVSIPEMDERPKSVASCTCSSASPGPSPRNKTIEEPLTDKSRNIYSFLDQVEKSDRDVLFSLKFDQSSESRVQIRSNSSTSNIQSRVSDPKSEQTAAKPQDFGFDFDTLVRKGSVELAKEFLLLQRKYEDTLHSVRVLEDTLLSQRELNMRNLRTAERDLQKRLRLQKEEFELALSRHQTFVDQLIAEKRALQDQSEKTLQVARENEEKHQTQVKALQEKHLEELRRLKKAREESARVHRVKWASTKTQEIQSNTVKNLAPEVQRLITRHQQEMAEARAWHADEVREIEERYARKQAAQAAEMREAVMREKEEVDRRQREEYARRLETERMQWREEVETQRAKLQAAHEEERLGWTKEKATLQQSSADALRRVEARMEVELETLATEHAKKIQALEARHAQEMKAVIEVHAAEKDNLQQTATTRQEQAVVETEARLRQTLEDERTRIVADTERRMRAEFKNLRRDEEEANDARMKRLSSKLKAEIADLEGAESTLKQRLSGLKSELAAQQDQCASLQTALAQKERQALDLNEANMKMVEERVNLTSVIRREFQRQIEELEEDSRAVKSSVVELKTKHKLELEARAAEGARALALKDEELERVAGRVKQTLGRKEETLEELRKQLDLAREKIRSLEELLEEQRREFLGEMVATNGKGASTTAGGTRKGVRQK